MFNTDIPLAFFDKRRERQFLCGSTLRIFKWYNKPERDETVHI